MFLNHDKKQKIFNKKVLQDFINLPLEEKLKIDEDPNNDGLFDTLQEMSDIVEEYHKEEIIKLINVLTTRRDSL